MSEIELKRANVVKRVDSEDKAKALEAKRSRYLRMLLQGYQLLSFC